jgi:hypothetical protein
MAFAVGIESKEMIRGRKVLNKVPIDCFNFVLKSSLSDGEFHLNDPESRYKYF